VPRAQVSSRLLRYPSEVDRAQRASGSSTVWCHCLLGMTLLVVNDAHCP
jgi:hypothetical protein